jgi:hypothetical protein
MSSDQAVSGSTRSMVRIKGRLSHRPKPWVRVRGDNVMD